MENTTEHLLYGQGSLKLYICFKERVSILFKRIQTDKRNSNFQWMHIMVDLECLLLY